MANARSACIFFLGVGAFLVNIGEAKDFLKRSSRQEHINDNIQTNLVAEVEATVGMDSATGKIKILETALAPMFAALPKNQQGYLGHATIRYALHRLFVQRHGWFMKGLHDAGSHRNSTSTAGLFKEQAPANVQDLFEQRLGSRGFGLHELAVMAAIIEHLVHKEAVQHVGQAFQVHSLLPTSVINASEADDVLDTYMVAYIYGDEVDLSNMTFEDVLEQKKFIQEELSIWGATQRFVRSVRENISRTEGSEGQAMSEVFDFPMVERVAERVAQQFGSFQNHECQEIKALLVAREKGQAGRVRLTEFWNPGLDGAWKFKENLRYLRQLGVLDESNPGNPRVMIANYVSAASNCMGESKFYSVCCMDECESILGSLEKQIAAPEASAKRIALLVSTLPSSSVAAPRILSKYLLERLQEIAGPQDNVQLHGRLFAQWMHHAFPRECPYPHVAGTTKPQAPEELFQSTGDDGEITDEEIERFMNNRSMSYDDKAESDHLLWSPVEELLTDRPVLKEAVV